MTTREDLDRYHAAYGEGFKFTDENLGMLAVYAERVRRHLAAAPGRSLLSLGIGHQLVSRALAGELGRGLRRYVVVEGSAERIASFRAAAPVPEGLELVHAWFEEYEPRERFDVIEMGFVLEHVDDPDLVVERYRDFLAPGGTLFMAVPNARSLHRLIGHEAGLLDDLYRLSPYDLELGHKRYFDRGSFTALAERHGLEIVSAEGLFLKPLTTDQLRRLELPEAVWRAFFKAGTAYPEIANAILLETRA